MRKRHLLFQVVTVLSMFTFGLMSPSTAEAGDGDGCWTCVNWGGGCPEQAEAESICLTWCFLPDAVACVEPPSPFCSAGLSAIFCTWRQQ